MLDFVSLQEWTLHYTHLNSLSYSVWDILQDFVYEGKREPFANLRSSECYHRQMA